MFIQLLQKKKFAKGNTPLVSILRGLKKKKTRVPVKLLLH